MFGLSEYKNNRFFDFLDTIGNKMLLRDAEERWIKLFAQVIEPVATTVAP